MYKIGVVIFYYYVGMTPTARADAILEQRLAT